MAELHERLLGRGRWLRGKQQKWTRELIWSRSLEGRQNERKLAELKGRHAGGRCFVMGNGPSLLKCDLSLLQNEITIASNAQYLVWDTIGFLPKFLTVEDCLVAEDRADELCALKHPIKIFPRDLLYCLSKSANAIFVNFTRDYQPFPKFSSNFGNIVYWGGTVSFLNLQLAYYLGCSEIILVGFDHRYHVPDEQDGHVITSQGDDVNHVHANYFGKGYRWHDPNLVRMEQSYAVARRFLDARGIPVRNATVGGELEIFERVDYRHLFRSS